MAGYKPNSLCRVRPGVSSICRRDAWQTMQPRNARDPAPKNRPTPDRSAQYCCLLELTCSTSFAGSRVLRVVCQPEREPTQARTNELVRQLAQQVSWPTRFVLCPANGSFPHAAQVVLGGPAHPTPTIRAASQRIEVHWPAIISRTVVSSRARFLRNQQQSLQDKIIHDIQRQIDMRP